MQAYSKYVALACKLLSVARVRQEWMVFNFTTGVQVSWKLIPNSWVLPSVQNQDLNLITSPVGLSLLIRNVQVHRRIRDTCTSDLRTRSQCSRVVWLFISYAMADAIFFAMTLHRFFKGAMFLLLVNAFL